MSRKWCCDQMARRLEHACPIHTEPMDCADAAIVYWPRFDEYVLPVRDGEEGKASSGITIQYCPWCGTKLPESKRTHWFAELKKRGFDEPLISDDIPEEFKSDAWYRGQP